MYSPITKHGEMANDVRTAHRQSAVKSKAFDIIEMFWENLNLMRLTFYHIFLRKLYFRTETSLQVARSHKVMIH